MESIDKFSLINEMPSYKIAYYLERILNPAAFTGLSEKSSIEMKEKLIDNISHQDIINLGLRSPEMNENALANRPASVPQLDFSRSYDADARRRIDLVA